MAQNTIHVRYGYFPEARPIHAACAKGWLDLKLPDGTRYLVTCHPQTSGNFASSRLDNGQLDIAHLGSTPLAQALARGMDLSVVYISHYMGDSQGIYVRASTFGYTGVEHPFDLKGRRIGVPFGSTMHYQVLYLLHLLGLTGKVILKDLAPSEIVQAWKEETIDAGACWGIARDFILNEGDAKTLLTAGVLANWGCPTFVALAAPRSFLQDQHSDFMIHMLAVLSRVNDSFLDRLGHEDPQNILRWDAQQPPPVSMVHSMTDALMASTEAPQNPSPDFVLRQRLALDLFEQLPASEQLSCDYLPVDTTGCLGPSLLYMAIRQTAEFLLDHKIISDLGPLSNDDVTTMIDGSFLQQATRTCSSCYPLGPYGNSFRTDHDSVLSELEGLDQQFTASPYALFEVGRQGGDSTCSEHETITTNIGTIGDPANALGGKTYSGRPFLFVNISIMNTPSLTVFLLFVFVR
jgi:taurine transport system substrate-binding protein